MKRNKGWIFMLIIGLTMFGLTACEGNAVGQKPTYEQITAAQAKTLMDTEDNLVILDVRTEEEFAEGHLEGAVLLPHDRIDRQAAQKLTDKHQLILVYCRSGRRSKIASEALAALGYTNVKEFGGILDWPYDVVR